MPLPEVLRAAYASLQRRLAIPGVRWVEPANLHLTLKFLGHLEPARLEAVGERLAACAREASGTRLSARGLTAFPRPRAARVLVVELDDASGALPRLHLAIDERVSDLGIEREARPFRLHLTLGRVREGALDVREALSGTAPPPGAWPVNGFALFRSRLGAGGPTYEVLESFSLTSGSGEGDPPTDAGVGEPVRRS